MKCAWNELLFLLPHWLRTEMGAREAARLQEIRMRINSPPELLYSDGNRYLARPVSVEDISFCMNAASSYSPWTSATLSRGFLTGKGGHRIGVCGDVLIKDGKMCGFQKIRSLCIRVARDFPGLWKHCGSINGSVIILGPPGWGKTTLLRDLSRQTSENETVAVVDERGEIFPEGISRGKRMDVLTGCGKAVGTEIVLRAMGPAVIALDEITAEEDAQAMIRGCGCGVRFFATAHASSVEDFKTRPIYRPLAHIGIFEAAVIMHRDKDYHIERIPVC